MGDISNLAPEPALLTDREIDDCIITVLLQGLWDLQAERNAYRAALVEIARHVASPGAEDMVDRLGVEDLPTLVECVTGRYTPKAGAEAEDLRRCMERYTDGPIADEMRAILDEVDARDSVRYLEEQDKPRIDVIGQLRERVAALEAALATERAARANGIPSGSLLCPDCHGESDEHCERCDDDGYIVPCEGCKADAHYEDSDGVPLCDLCFVEMAADAAKEAK